MGNNPVNYVDPTGHFAWWVGGAIIGGIVGGVAGAWYGYQENGCLWCSETMVYAGGGAAGGALVGAGLGWAAGYVAGALGTEAAATTTALSTKALGEQGQKWLERVVGPGGQAQVGMRTEQGRRVIDYLKDGVAHESKNEFVKLTKSFMDQAVKDALLMRDSSSGVNEVVWHFWKGASKEVLDFLAEQGIKWIVY